MPDGAQTPAFNNLLMISPGTAISLYLRMLLLPAIHASNSINRKTQFLILNASTRSHHPRMRNCHGKYRMGREPCQKYKSRAFYQHASQRLMNAFWPSLSQMSLIYRITPLPSPVALAARSPPSGRVPFPGAELWPFLLPWHRSGIPSNHGPSLDR